MASVKEVSIWDMNDERRFVVYDNVSSDELDPLETLLLLEEEAQEAGFDKVSDFIKYSIVNKH